MVMTRQPLFDSSVAAFLAGGLGNLWIDLIDTKTDKKAGEVYVRKGQRALNGERMRSFDVSNIQVDPDKVGSGIFTRWLNRLEFCSRFEEQIDVIYIENVQDKRFQDFIEARGYTLVNIPGVGEDDPKSYFRIVEPYPDGRFASHICYMGHQEETCRYLALGRNGFACAKLVPNFKQDIDQRVVHMSAKADNCFGLKMR